MEINIPASEVSKRLEETENNVRIWEAGFKIEFERAPTDDEISARPRIARIYADYRTLKRRAEKLKLNSTASEAPLRLESISQEVTSGDELPALVLQQPEPNQVVAASGGPVEDSQQATQELDDVVDRHELSSLGSEALLGHSSSFFSMFMQISQSSPASLKSSDSSSSQQKTLFSHLTDNSQDTPSPSSKPLAKTSSAIFAKAPSMKSTDSVLRALAASALKKETTDEPIDVLDRSEFESEINPEALDEHNSVEEVGIESENANSPFGVGTSKDDVVSAGQFSFHSSAASLRKTTSELLPPVATTWHGPTFTNSLEYDRLNEGDASQDGVRKSTDNKKRKRDVMVISDDEQDDIKDYQDDSDASVDSKPSKLKQTPSKKAKTTASSSTPKKVAAKKAARRENFVRSTSKGGKKVAGSGSSTRRAPLQLKANAATSEDEIPTSVPIEEIGDFEPDAIPISSEPTLFDVLPAATGRPELEHILREHFGFTNFRDGQYEAIERVLRLESTLLLVPTGGGKSLTYQLPAKLLNTRPGDITLVITPLISLMQDQLANLPPFLPGACLGSHQRTEENNATIDSLRAGTIKVLFISPEKLCSRKFLQLITSTALKISFACIDEAHCISQWSHNFRPAYLVMSKILREVLKVKCILALTATATRQTQQSIASLLGIPDDGIFQYSPIRPNLQLIVTQPANKYEELERLLKRDTLKNAPVIIYVNFKNQAEELAKYLYNKCHIHAECYHAGKSAYERRVAQEMFMNGKRNVIVATVAFGMGINKANIRGIIHFCIPRTLENYVQEVGRAGRDGNVSECHLLLNHEDVQFIKSVVFTDTMERFQVRQLISQVFHKNPSKSNKSKNNDNSLAGRTVILPIMPLEQSLDVQGSVVSTFLAWLEMEGLIKSLPDIDSKVELSFFNSGPEKLKVMSGVIATMLKIASKSQAKYTFNIQDVADAMGQDVVAVIAELEHLKSQDEIKYTTREKGFHMKIRRSSGDDDALIERLFQKQQDMEASNVIKSEAMHFIAMEGIRDPSGEALKSGIVKYFTSETLEKDAFAVPDFNVADSTLLANDLKIFLSRNMDSVTNGRQVARIFHGIQSPCFSSELWCRNPFWGRGKSFRFKDVAAAAQAALIQLKTQAISK